MPNEPLNRIGPDDLSAHDKQLAGIDGQSSELAARRRAPVTIQRLFGGSIPKRPDITQYRDTYTRLANSPIHIFSLDTADTDFLAVFPPLNALDANTVLLFASPVKEPGLNTLDIIADQMLLYNGSRFANKLQRQHAEMPGWRAFEQSGIFGLFTRNCDPFNFLDLFENMNPDDVVIPVIRSSEKNGQRTLSLTPLTDELRTQLHEQLPEYVTDPDRLDGIMGLAFLAAYSPDHAKWPQKSKFLPSLKDQPTKAKDLTDKESENDAPYDGNDIGTPQVLALITGKIAQRQADPTLVPDDQDLQQSQLLASLDSYARTGELPI